MQMQRILQDGSYNHAAPIEVCSFAYEIKTTF
jgi:hypothetical protein